MKKIFALFALYVASSNLFADKFVSGISGVGDTVDKSRYGTAMIANGHVSTVIDYLGLQKQQRYAHLTPAVSVADRRYGQPVDYLISHGWFDAALYIDGKEQKPIKWTQTLDTKSAFSENVVEYPDATVKTVAFVPANRKMLVVKKTVVPKAPSKVKFGFKYTFAPSMPAKPRDRAVTTGAFAEKNCARFVYKLYGLDVYRGEISITSTADAKVSFVENNDAAFLESEADATPEKPFESVYYMTYEDDYDGSLKPQKNIDYTAASAAARKSALSDGFDKIFAEHKAEWGRYWDGVSVSIPDEKLERAYHTALYHMKCIATRWGFPVGIFAGSHFGGAYFGWDETFCMLALASTGKFDISRVSVDFRRTVLPKAMNRVGKYGRAKRITVGARYTWQTYDPKFAELEKATPGYWIEHIFHMSNISLQAWTQYLYTNDRAYLEKTVYPIVSECAAYYLANHLYETRDGDLIVGYSTDLERLGPAKLNAFMTSCGIVYTLERAAEGAEILGVDSDFAEKCRAAAARLRKSFANDGKKYIPYDKSKDKSINVVAGLFPYPVNDPENPLQKNAVYDYFKNIDKAGNMYSTGKSVNAWYAGWTISALVPYSDNVVPAQLLEVVARNLGAFGATFEINEPENRIQYHPWFSTAAGNIVYALNKMMLFSEENGGIKIAPSVPESWRDFSYTLPTFGGLKVSVKAENGRLVYAELLGENGRSREISVPKRLVDVSKISGGYKDAGGYITITAKTGAPFYKN